MPCVVQVCPEGPCYRYVLAPNATIQSLLVGHRDSPAHRSAERLSLARMWMANRKSAPRLTHLNVFPLSDLAPPALVSTPMRIPAIWARRSSVSIRGFATVSSGSPRIPQTVIEKVVQRFAVDLPAGKAVKAGDYVMIRPERVITHDNTGPVISK